MDWINGQRWPGNCLDCQTQISKGKHYNLANLPFLEVFNISRHLNTTTQASLIKTFFLPNHAVALALCGQLAIKYGWECREEGSVKSTAKISHESFTGKVGKYTDFMSRSKLSLRQAFNTKNDILNSDSLQRINTFLFLISEVYYNGKTHCMRCTDD